MSYLSMDVSTKLKKNDVKGYVNHVFRKSSDKNIRHSNEEIDSSLTSKNIDFHLESDGRGKSFEERLENRMKDYSAVTKKGKPRKIRDDAVLARGLLLQPSPDVFEGKSIQEKRELIDKFTQDAMPFLIKRFSRENILGISAHLDETNPHVHAAVAMITSDGRLSQKDFFPGPKQLAAMHKEFREHMNDKGWSFEIENKNEDTKHYSDNDYKRNAEAIEEARLQYTASKRKYQKEFSDLSAEREELEKERNQLAEERRLFEENQKIQNEALRARQSALTAEVKEEYQKAKETAQIEVLTSFRSTLKDLYKDKVLASKIAQAFNNRFFGANGLGGSKALEEEKNQSINEQVQRASEGLDLEL